MTQTVEAVFDGTVLHPEKVLELLPNTRVRLTVEVLLVTPPGASSFLRTAREQKLSGPADWSAKVDNFLYSAE